MFFKVSSLFEPLVGQRYKVLSHVFNVFSKVLNLPIFHNWVLVIIINMCMVFTVQYDKFDSMCVQVSVHSAEELLTCQQDRAKWTVTCPSPKVLTVLQLVWRILRVKPHSRAVYTAWEWGLTVRWSDGWSITCLHKMSAQILDILCTRFPHLYASIFFK